MMKDMRRRLNDKPYREPWTREECFFLGCAFGSFVGCLIFWIGSAL